LSLAGTKKEAFTEEEVIFLRIKAKAVSINVAKAPSRTTKIGSYKPLKSMR
jgi:hypothetical protein